MKAYSFSSELLIAARAKYVCIHVFAHNKHLPAFHKEENRSNINLKILKEGIGHEYKYQIEGTNFNMTVFIPFWSE